ncbi:hypothetical protein HOK51_06160 [Candidatus Woesearchaeota archaeon]|nr:hypothetical protein [Candidatus Woesearchaeota archaeon]MBT6519409.1 hypothetical protein [Candidatus Woesearchaeota archaeon]MBT7368081.1 hypothetical protein [Candidatus Woesearchaeota archaeon]
MASANATTADGSVNLNISAYLSISLDDSTIEFGQIAIENSLVGPATCDSYTGVGTNILALNDQASACNNTKDVFQITNDGNFDANITVASSKSNTNFLCTTCDQNPSFEYKVVDDACEGTSDQDTYKNFTNTDRNELCADLDPADAFNVSLKILIPIDVQPTQKTATLNFTASCANANCENN